MVARDLHLVLRAHVAQHVFLLRPAVLADPALERLLFCVDELVPLQSGLAVSNETAHLLKKKLLRIIDIGYIDR